MMSNSKSTLPQEYQKVLWIQADTDSYIDTEFIPSSDNIICEQVVLFPSQRDYNIGFYRHTSGNSNLTLASGCNFTYMSQWQLRSSGGWLYSSATAQINTIYNIKIEATNSKQTMYIDGVSVRQTSGTINLQGMGSFYLFITHTGYVNTFSSDMKLYSAKIYDNGVLVRDYIPCYRKSDMEPGLYDTVNNKFYYSGASSFISGPNDI